MKKNSIFPVTLLLLICLFFSCSRDNRIFVRHIQVDSKEKAEEILKELKEGKESFETLAARYSKCPSRVNGGKLEPFTRGTQEKKFEEAALKLKINQISEPVETELGWEIIERLPLPTPVPTPSPAFTPTASPSPVPTITPLPSSVRIRHILVETKGEAEEIVKELKEGKDFTELALDKSYCPSRTKGGDLGIIGYRSNLAGSVKKVAFKLKINEISEPVKSEYGYHIIQRIDPDMKIEVKEREKIRVRHILVEKEEEAKEVIKELEEGEDFSEVALEKSLCPSRVNGGDLGMISMGMLAKPLENTAYSLKINELSKPVQTEYGWHVVQRIDPDLMIKVPPVEIRVSHILVNTQKEADKIEEELKKGADFTVLAREYSECAGSKNKGGDLGKIKRGDMAKNFQKAAFSLEVGGISEPVQLRDGWHIIKRTE
ncbi:MAG: peptidylprolyl isomerase [Candidatus Eremiobacterota bacterium]